MCLFWNKNKIMERRFLLKEIIEDSLSHTKKVTITVKYIKLRLYYSYATIKIKLLKYIFN